MMSPAMAVRTEEPATGVSVRDWFCEDYSVHMTGQSYPTTLISGLKPFEKWGEFDLLMCGVTMTDPGAEKRVQNYQLVDWSKNLARLGAVAKAIIPELRAMTSQEQTNLRQYYRKLYRKV
jgi:hypothetical protein